MSPPDPQHVFSFHSRKCIWKYRLLGHFVEALMCWSFVFRHQARIRNVVPHLEPDHLSPIPRVPDRHCLYLPRALQKAQQHYQYQRPNYPHSHHSRLQQHYGSPSWWWPSDAASVMECVSTGTEGAGYIPRIMFVLCGVLLWFGISQLYMSKLFHC